MAEESKNDKYISCSKCKCKHINDEAHINTDIGYTRLEERYKTCNTCRERRQLTNKKYYDNHKEMQKEYKHKHNDEHKEERQSYDVLSCLERT